MKKDNVYRNARKKAAEKNFLLNDSKNSQEFLGIDKSKLLAIENGKKALIRMMLQLWQRFMVLLNFVIIIVPVNVV